MSRLPPWEILFEFTVLPATAAWITGTRSVKSGTEIEHNEYTCTFGVQYFGGHY